MLRQAGKFELEYEDHDFDVLWFTIPKPAGYTDNVRAFISQKHNYLVLPKYPAHLQCGLLLRPDEYAQYRKSGVADLKKELLSAHPLFKEFASSLKDFGPFTLLFASADRVKKWAKPGLMLVGDAAHTCSPAGAIGVSVATATAIVSAEVILKALEKNDFSEEALGEVQRLREKDVKKIQAIQNNAASLVAARSGIGKNLALAAIFLLGRTPLFKKAQQTLMVMSEPLPIRPSLRA